MLARVIEPLPKSRVDFVCQRMCNIDITSIGTADDGQRVSELAISALLVRTGWGKCPPGEDGLGRDGRAGALLVRMGR